MLTIESVTNPVWNNAEHTQILLQVKFEEFEEILPFTATPYDVMPYGVFLFNNAKEGLYGEVAPYVPYDPTQPDIDTQTA
jgi:hypothetical protein